MGLPIRSCLDSEISYLGKGSPLPQKGVSTLCVYFATVKDESSEATTLLVTNSVAQSLASLWYLHATAVRNWLRLLKSSSLSQVFIFCFLLFIYLLFI